MNTPLHHEHLARWRHVGMALAAFALPALALAVPSGYSWAALLILALGLAGWWHGPRPAPDCRILWWGWGLSVAVMGVVWSMDAWQAQPFRVNTLDRPLKFALALVALPAAWSMGSLQARALKRGVIAGALGAAALAAWQVHAQGLERAWGHTNAIHFGNLALLLGLWSWIWTRHRVGWIQAVGLLGTLGGAYASIASEARGGWLVAPVLVLLVLWLDRPRPPHHPHAHRWRLTPTVIVLSATLLLATQWDVLSARAHRAWHETMLHQTSGISDTSVGQRLAHWKLAWDLGWDRPWTGWSEDGYHAEKDRRVARGEIPPILSGFGHAHNEWLDMWAKRGLPGVLALVLLFTVPGVAYARTLRRETPEQPSDPSVHLAALCGLTLVLGYVGFGMTQVMFAHNSGTMVYLFMNLLLLGLVSATPASRPPPAGPAPG